MRFATIIAGAPLPDHETFYRGLIAEAAYLVAADSGAELCRSAERVPDALVGDLDSVSPEVLRWAESEGAAVVRASAEKDFSDLDLALRVVSEAGIEAVRVSAAWSGRLDHTLASLGSIARVPSVVVDVVDPGMAGWVLRPENRTTLRLAGPGAICSLFAVDGPAVVSTRGMRYELTAGTLAPLSTHGLSNVLDAESVLVTVHSGVLVVLSNPMDDGVVAYELDAE